jgi:hypothetical protein
MLHWVQVEESVQLEHCKLIDVQAVHKVADAR